MMTTYLIAKDQKSYARTFCAKIDPANHPIADINTVLIQTYADFKDDLDTDDADADREYEKLHETALRTT